ncbi:hypothetical protein SAMN05661010_02515 [Modicisalibacter muralis]|uniref:DUF1902 domain-containing protein n=1 Tax=Modicisalibacter muralis TaxID=119000 RepID=A0A1G9MTI3_9GAMM|nr:hypothetical protein [Halomonas muralis]SDL77616.1 hypothetical protein SAMN05661010_02515 [Halomonas muralis]
MSSKKPNQLVLRCLLEQDGDLYLAYCIDLCLGVQGDSPEEVRDSLHAMIDDYLCDARQAYVQGDRDEFNYMMNRRAPLSIRLRYHAAAVPGLAWVIKAYRQFRHKMQPKPYYEPRDFNFAC